MVIKSLKQFEHKDWESYWAGNWSILAFSYWGEFYTRKGFSKGLDKFVIHSMISWEQGKSVCYLRHAEKKAFAEDVVKIVQKDEGQIKKINQNMKVNSDRFVWFVKRWKGKDITLDQFKEYNQMIFSYYIYHIQNKVVVDFLPEELLKKYFALFEQARVYAEPVFTKSIDFMQALAEIHAVKTGYPAELIQAMVKEEFEDYLLMGKLPARTVLEARNQKSFFLFSEGKLAYLLTGKDCSSVEDILHVQQKREMIQKGMVRGTTAYPGKVQGKVRIILDPTKVDKHKIFHQGDILVSGMTRPEYLPFIKKASAIITDAGGLLCHAAITSREMKKPCVIGTKTATKVLKDGDLVEVDADKGMVRIVKQVRISMRMPGKKK